MGLRRFVTGGSPTVRTVGEKEEVLKKPRRDFKTDSNRSKRQRERARRN